MTLESLAIALAGVLVGAVAVAVASRARRGHPEGGESQTLGVPAERGESTELRLLRALPFAAFVFDRDAHVLFVNPAAELLFEISAQRAIGRALIEVVPSVEFERVIVEALHGHAVTRDVRIIDAKRERIFGITAHQIDEELIAIVSDRTALVSIERVRRDFVANVSHELRTPLAAIKLMVETVLLADDDAEARALFLPRVAQEVDRMVQLVEDLLELARSESGRLVLRTEVFDLTEIATSVVNTFAQRANGLDIDLSLEAPAPVFIDADCDRLTQVAVNLVDNALRHTPAGGKVSVEVATEGLTAVLRVRDTGIGIPYHDLPHIFERFYVVDRSRSRDHSGNGLGLSIARHLVEAQNGTIEVESVFGAGATFSVRFATAPTPNIKAP
jgi:two-component system phosphate regulon sensor histidine kinase PhoR